ncbi:MAG: hypothetical protein EBR30_05235 [Cytophagia bacterium]|nr:hypothetical protein [Cytophagia bacterium]NBW34416.1 hypothetical protein [Cytophagia bacterium]
MGFKVGGHLPTAGMALPGFVELSEDSTQRALVATLGAGVDVNILAGYQFSENVMLNVDIGYLSGFKGGFYRYEDVVRSGTFNRIDINFKGTFFSISPNLVIKANEKEGKMRPFARMGLHMGSGVVKATTTIDIFEGKRVDEYAGGWAVGWIGGMGLSKQINDQLSATLELTVKTITTRPKQRKNLENFTGVPIEDTISYKKELQRDSPKTDQLTFPIPFSSIGLTAGIQYKLGK